MVRVLASLFSTEGLVEPDQADFPLADGEDESEVAGGRDWHIREGSVVERSAFFVVQKSRSSVWHSSLRVRYRFARRVASAFRLFGRIRFRCPVSAIAVGELWGALHEVFAKVI